MGFLFWHVPFRFLAWFPSRRVMLHVSLPERTWWPHNGVTHQAWVGMAPRLSADAALLHINCLPQTLLWFICPVLVLLTFSLLQNGTRTRTLLPLRWHVPPSHKIACRRRSNGLFAPFWYYWQFPCCKIGTRTRTLLPLRWHVPPSHKIACRRRSNGLFAPFWYYWQFPCCKIGTRTRTLSPLRWHVPPSHKIACRRRSNGLFAPFWYYWQFPCCKIGTRTRTLSPLRWHVPPSHKIACRRRFYGLFAPFWYYLHSPRCKMGMYTQPFATSPSREIGSRIRGDDLLDLYAPIL